jgi:putative alpha-1,2-mannosidase
MESEYGTEEGGLSGNDDAGQMSAWYVFAALGFYPVCPSVWEYVISGPVFEKITLSLEGGNELIILAPGASSGKKYIHSLKVNGAYSDLNFLTHAELIEGGILEFEMGNDPCLEWGIAKGSRPFSLGLD